MASSALVKYRSLIGLPLTEVIVLGADGDLILMNVVIQEVGRDFLVLNQAGSGGLGTVIVPLDKIVGII
ncbi:MAG: hypothetical protein WBV93_10805 [Anaerobacillus sp.]